MYTLDLLHQHQGIVRCSPSASTNPLPSPPRLMMRLARPESGSKARPKDARTWPVLPPTRGTSATWTRRSELRGPSCEARGMMLAGEYVAAARGTGGDGEVAGLDKF